MPAAWAGVVVGAAGLADNLYNQSQGNTPSGGAAGYTPVNAGQANQGWSQAFGGLQSNAVTGQNEGAPLYQQTLNAQNAINYNPYLGAANQAGYQYGQLANQAGQNNQIYQNAAQTAQNQQGGLYNAGNQLLGQAFNNNNAQYNMNANNLAGQVNAGQAQRGLGNSPVGGQEYNNAMSNFNTQWNTQQLQNEQLGIQGAANASNAGGAQGQLMGADMAAALGAGGQQAAYTQQGAGVPLNAQQYVAGQPAANANQFASGMGTLQGLQGNVTGAALPYLTGSQSGQQFNTVNNQQQNAANTALLTKGLSGSPGSWLSNLFGGQSNQGTAPSDNSGLGGYSGLNGLGSQPYSLPVASSSY